MMDTYLHAYYDLSHSIEVIVGRALGWYREQPGDPGYTEGVETYATGDHTPETMVAALARAYREAL